jgi:hypothetical protein
LLERNMKETSKILKGCKEVKKIREAFKKSFGIEMDDEKNFPINDSSFSFGKAFSKLTEAKANMTENEALSSWIGLTRAGIQQIVNTAYQANNNTSYEEFAHILASNKAVEQYYPIQGITFPNEVPHGGHYPEAAMDGVNTQLANKKFGEIFSFELELENYDQSGNQVINQAKLLGQYMKILWEVLCQGKLASVTAGCTYGGFKVPASETKPSSESTWPFSTSLVGGGRNRPDTYGILSDTNIKAGFNYLAGQKNILGLLMAVNPTCMLTTPFYRWDSAVLANSSYYASNVIATTAGTTIGGPMSINPIQGIFKPVISPYMFDQTGVVNPVGKVWYLCDNSVPAFVLQVVEFASIIQENPAAGESFNRDVIRYKVRSQGNADFIEPRFFWRGDDGSVTS